MAERGNGSPAEGASVTKIRMTNIAAMAALLLLGACQDPGPTEMEGTDRQAVPKSIHTSRAVSGGYGVAAAATPHAARAGAEILGAGGNAVDAAVAAAFAVGVTEPGGSSLGGGGAMTLWHEGHADHVEFYSSAAGERASDGRARNVAVPGKVGGLMAAHERYGSLPRETVLEPAVRLARDGFEVYPRLASQISSYPITLQRHPETAEAFYPNGRALRTGDLLVQPRLAESLERIAQEGRDGFYQGPTAEAMAEKLQGLDNPMTLGDLAQYEPNWRRPLCGAFRDFTVLSAPPPMGGIEVIKTLNLLDAFPMAEEGRLRQAPEAASRYADALRLARADRRIYLGDPDRGVPAVGIASRRYAEQRQALMGQEVTARVSSGDPWTYEDQRQPERCRRLDPYGPSPVRPGAAAAPDGPVAGDASPEGPETALDGGDPTVEETTHLSVVDLQGNTVSITMTLGPLFGARVYAAGFFFNNAISRFSSRRVNEWGPYRTPQSSITPSVVLDESGARLAAGSPGGVRIPQATVHTILQTLEYEQGLSPALNSPRLYATSVNRTVRVEAGFRAPVTQRLEDRGFTVEIRDRGAHFGGVNAVLVDEDGRRVGAGDPRRSGEASGF